MLDRLKLLLGWLRSLFVPPVKRPALTALSRPTRGLPTLPWIMPLCRSWPAPRHGKTGVAALKRAARKRRHCRRARRA